MPGPIDEEKWRLWAERVWRFEQSGLTGAEWCRREGLPLEQYYLWWRKLPAHGGCVRRACRGCLERH
ncbi:MAG: hypothetical protein K6T86_02320 [Pirellulales bacterium]|nr:hypothetical protein [Pirellulales bacterium]